MLSADKKCNHSLYDCKECLKNKNMKSAQAKLPVKNVCWKAKATSMGLYKEKILKDITNKIVKNLDDQFQKNFRTTFTKQFNKVNKEIINKSVSSEKEVIKSVKQDIEKQWKETSVERLENCIF